MKPFSALPIVLLSLLLLLLGGAATWAYFSHWWFLGALCSVGGVGVLFLSLHLVRRQGDKISFLFSALENADYTFRFQTDVGSKNDRLLNQSLNRIKELITKTIMEGRLRERYYEEIIDSAAGGVVVIDEKGFIYQCNSAARLLFGLNVFTHVSQLAQIDSEIPTRLMEIRTGENRTLSFYNERAKRTVSLQCSEFRYHDKWLKICSLSDISSSIEGAEVESWQRLSRVLTHEIMNSLAPVTSLSEALLDCEGEDVRRGLEVINSTSRSLIHFVENYRTLTHLPIPNRAEFALDAMLAEVVQLFESDVRVVQCPEELHINSDENLLRGVIINLVRNGLQAGGEVTLSAHSDAGGRTLIHVADTGCGISEQIAQNMYVPFFTTKEGGSGIGLSLARQVILSLGGTLTLLPTPPETQGTIFQVALPIH